MAVSQDRPDPTTLAALDRAAGEAGRRAASVRADRATTESVLDGWRRQDPAKPADPATDPEVVSLRHLLQPTQAQIAKAEQLSALAGGGVAKPPADGDEDPLLAQLQARAKQLTDRIDARQAELARTAGTPPADRARQREAAMELLSVKLTGLKQSEADATADADSTAASAAAANAKADAARAADANARDLFATYQEAEAKLRDASKDQGEQQAAVDAAVTVDGSAASNPDVSVPGGEHDARPLVALVGAAVLFAVLFLWLLGVAGTGNPGGGGPAGYAEEDAAEEAAALADPQPVGV